VKILQILPKNTSTLDFSYPYFQWLYDNKKKYEVEVLVWGESKSKVFKDRKYIEDLRAINVKVTSLKEYAPNRYRKFMFDLGDKSDRLSREEINFKSIPSSVKSLKSILKWVGEKYRERILKISICPFKIINLIRPDFVLYDQRVDSRIVLESKLKKAL